MARRASAIDKLRTSDQGLIIVDAGDALFALPRNDSAIRTGELNKGTTLMQAYALLGLDALAVGEGDLAAGVDWLQGQAKRAGVTLLSANLADRRNRRPFAERKLVESAGVKVGLTAVTELLEIEREAQAILQRAKLKALDTVASARAQVSALRREGAEIIVLLAHTGLSRARELAREVEGLHLVVVGHSGARLTSPERVGTTVLVEAGRRGQAIGHVELRLGPGWSVSERFADDSPRHVLYQEASSEIARLRDGTGRSVRIRREVVLERAQKLVAQLGDVAAPAGPHTLISRIFDLDGNHREHPAMRGLLASSRESWAAR